MASSVVVLPVNAAAAADNAGLDITYSVAFAKDDGTLDIDLVVATIAPGDSPNTINAKIATAVRARATAMGYSIPTNGVAIPSYTKG